MHQQFMFLQTRMFFFVLRGRAQRLKLPLDLAGKVLNNLLEFIVEIICMSIDILEREINLCNYYLSLSNNSSAVNWLYRSNFDSEDQQMHEEAVYQCASLYINEEVYQYLQHFKGIQNVVVDFLSCDTHIPNNVIISLLFLVCTKQLLINFHISPLLLEIESWVFRTLQLSSKLPLDSKEQTTSAIGLGFIGSNFWTVLSYLIIYSWILLQQSFNL